MHPAAKTRLADPQILRYLRHRLLTATDQFHRPTTELSRLSTWHNERLSETIIASEQVSGKWARP